MKNQKMPTTAIKLIIFLLLISCGGAPKTTDTPPSAEETPQPVAAQSDPNQQAPKKDALDALNTAMSRAENARKKALDVQGQTYFPDEWKTAETKNDAAKNMKKDTADGVNEAIALYTAAAEAYESIADKSGTLLAKEQEDARAALEAAMARAEQSRTDALDNQGPAYFPKDWETAESKHQNGKDAKKDTTDEIKAAVALYTSAADTYDDIANKSRPLLAKEKDDALKALQAAMARAERSRTNAQDAKGQTYFPKDWETAESKHQNGKDAKKDTADEIKAAVALYVAAADSYDAIANKSRPLLAKEKDDALKALNAAMTRAENSRKQTMDVEGQTYFPNDWKTAESKNQSGKNAKKDTTDEIKAAAALYISAADTYDDITRKSRPLFAKDKEDAQKALNAAMARAEQSRKDAQNVEGQTYFPNEWKNAETKNQSGKDAKKTTAAEIKAAAALYNTAADGYDDIVRKNNARLAKEQEDARKALQAAMARAEQSRKQAQEVQGPVYFPKDWQTAESQNQSGKDAKKETTEEIKTAIALYNTAADTYDDIAGKSRPLFAKDKDDAQKALQTAMARAEQSRKQAQEVQGPVYFPKDWQTAESQNQSGKDAKKETAEEIKTATALYNTAADTYDDITSKSRSQLAKEQEDARKALQAAMARAEQSRKQAQEVQGPVYFPKDWQTAESQNQSGKDAKKETTEEIKTATALYNTAADTYDDIAGKSRPLFAKEQEDARKALQAAMARAEQSRKQAQEVQGPVYFPKDWQTAESQNKAGKDAKKTTIEEIKAAVALYTKAADTYDDITGKSRPLFVKDREDADKALQAAMARAEQSRKQAQEVQGPVYFPKDWQTAESKNQAGKDAKKTTAEEIKAAVVLYNSAADTYDDIAGRSRSLAAQEKDEALKAEALNTLQAAMARAEQSRRQALNFQGPAYFPSDWGTAETQNQSGEGAKRNTPEEIKAATAFYTAAANAYDDITRKSRPRYIQEWEDALKRERTAATEAGIAAIAPEQLNAADRSAAETRRNLESSDYIPNEEAVSLPVDMYRALKPRADGYKVRQEIIERGFAEAAPNVIAAGDKNTSASVQDYNAGNPGSAWDKADEALKQYNEALLRGWLVFAQVMGLEASKERQAAVDVKAPVAVREDFYRADRIYQQALTDFGAEAYEAAADLYSQSSAQFIAAAQSAEEKRRRAEETIAAAKQKTAESTTHATNMGLMMEGDNE